MSTITRTRPAHRLLAALVVALLFAGCTANANKPIVDMKGVSPSLYEQDLGECKEYADEVAMTEKALSGAAAGAAVGAAVGVIWDGHNGNNPGRGAATGAVLGGSGGVASGVTERSQVVKNCLRNRGYRVLN
ncbi:MAG: glycine zipper family protein [Gammaproteobacteria bacterium]